jgi:uncharacterized protein (UPF0335 family)
MQSQDSLVLRREDEKNLVRGISEQLGAYVTRVKRIEDEKNRVVAELEACTLRFEKEARVLRDALAARER